MNDNDADRRQYAIEGLARIAEPRYLDQISRLVLTEKNGDVWITVTTIVEEPKYLTGPYITSSGFKKEADGEWRLTTFRLYPVVSEGGERQEVSVPGL